MPAPRRTAHANSAGFATLTALVLSLPCARPTAAQAACAGGPPTPCPVSASISEVRYDVTFDASTSHSSTIKVAMSFAVAARDAREPVLLSLPAWTPGAYELGNFARRVTRFAATAGGDSLGWDKLDYDTWRVRPNGARALTVSFDFKADSLDNAESWARPDFAFFNGTNLFFYPEGRGSDFPSTVVLSTEPTWLVATGMRPAAGAKVPAGARAYAAASYDELVDMPFFVGRFDFDSARVAGKWMRFASYPAGSVAGRARAQVWSDVARIVPAAAAVFGDVPWDSYTILQANIPDYPLLSALEHANSHLAIFNALAVGTPLTASFYAHEIVHAWNVKRLRPAELVPYRYDRPQPTPWLWVSEGVTEYYSDLAQVRGGVTDSAGFFRATSQKMNAVAAARPAALEDASLSVWVSPTDGTGDLYYDKGALAGLMLDILIRDASDGRHSLDDAMRELYQTTYKRGAGFGAEEWWGAVSRAANGKSFADFARRYVDGREPYPMSSVLALAGMRLVTDTLRSPVLGVYSAADSAGLRITGVERESSAAAAGVKEGDYLLEIGGVPLQDESWATKYRSRYSRSPEGTPYPLRVRRGAQTLTLSAPLKLNLSYRYSIAADSAASPKAARIRSGILRGKVEK